MIPELGNKYSEKNGDCVFPDAVLNLLPIGVIAVDKDMRIVFANKTSSVYEAVYENKDEKVLLSYALQCGGAGQNLVCEYLPECENCQINRLVKSIFENTAPTSGLEYRLSASLAGAKHAKWLRVYGSKLFINGEVLALISFEDISVYKTREANLMERLQLDLATQTLNKYSLAEHINSLGKQGNNESFTVCMTDFDDFKLINDFYGHITGDEVLNTFSAISRKIIRADDIIGRYGGEEFVFVFMDTDITIASNIICRIKNELKSRFAGLIKQPVTFSAGLIYIDCNQCHSFKYTDLIDQLDKLLYIAKGKGKNCIVTSEFIRE